MARLSALILWLWATAAGAQIWAPAQSDDGHFVYHTVRAGVGFGFACFAPSLQGKTAFEAGAHEVQATAPGMIRLEFAPALIPFRGQGRTDVILWVDGTGYLLPETTYSDFYGYWGVSLKWGDALFEALDGVATLVLAPGQDRTTALSVTRLGQALAVLRRDCPAAWRAAQGVSGAAVAAITVPPQVADYVTQGCNAPTPLRAEAITAVDLDRDSAPDFIVNWGAITCPGANPRPFCGAANCSHALFLSSRRFAAPHEISAISLTAVQTPYGTGLARVGSFSLCGPNGELCAAPLVWDGAAFTERP